MNSTTQLKSLQKKFCSNVSYLPNVNQVQIQAGWFNLSGFLFNNAFIPNKFFKELVPNITVLETKRNRNLSEPSSKKQYFFKSFQFSWSWGSHLKIKTNDIDRPFFLNIFVQGKVRPKNYKIWNRLNIFEESTFLCTFQQIFYQMKFLRK